MAGTWNGNVVSYGTGGHWYVQVSISDNGATTAATTGLHITSRVVFENSIVDSSNTISGSDPSGTWSADNTAFSGAGAYIVQQRDFECSILYTGSTAVITMTANGMAGGGTGPSSVTVNYPMPARTPLPPNPPTVAARAITATSANIYTTAAGAENGATTDLVNYRIHRVSDGLWMGDQAAGYDGTTYTNLAPNTNYNAYGQSHNAAGWGGFSAPYNFTTPSTIPSAPSGLISTAVSATTATVSWTAGSDGGSAITSYQVQYSVDSTFATGVTTASSGSLTGLTPGSTYSYRVRAVNVNGPGAWSVTATFATLTGMRVFNGTAFVQAPVYAWNGTSWVVCEVRIFNGTAWVPTG